MHPSPTSFRGQFHQHVYTKLISAQIPKAQQNTVKLSVFFALLESARAKAACRILMKLTPGVNFTNMFICSFYALRSQDRKWQLSHQCLFALLESVRPKAALKTLVKLTPCWRSNIFKGHKKQTQTLHIWNTSQGTERFTDLDLINLVKLAYGGKVLGSSRFSLLHLSCF